MLRTWLAATALSAALARTGPRCQAALILSIRQSVAAAIEAEFPGTGARSVPRQGLGAFVAAVASGLPARACDPKIAAQSDAAAANSVPQGLLVLRAPPDRVHEYLQVVRTGAPPVSKIPLSAEISPAKRLRRPRGGGITAVGGPEGHDLSF
jgi:hypothetical protein